MGALHELGIDLAGAHRIDGLRMIAGKKTRELAWPTTDRFPNHGAVWPRRLLDGHLIDAAIAAGAEVRFETEALPVLDDDRVVGADAGGERFIAPLTILAAGAQGMAAKIVGAERDPDEPFGLASATSRPASACATSTAPPYRGMAGCSQPVTARSTSASVRSAR